MPSHVPPVARGWASHDDSKGKVNLQATKITRVPVLLVLYPCLRIVKFLNQVSPHLGNSDAHSCSPSLTLSVTSSCPCTPKERSAKGRAVVTAAVKKLAKLSFRVEVMRCSASQTSEMPDQSEFPFLSPKQTKQARFP